MSESLYRRNSKDSNVVDILKARRQLLNSSVIQVGSGQTASSRNPAWVIITGYDKSCGGSGSMPLPEDKTTWEDTYAKTGGGIKPGPDLESVTIEYGGDWGLARKLSASIRCYTIKDFERVQKNFLLPGNEVDVQFGYKMSWGVSHPTTTIKGFKVATFSFNTTSEGFWMCSFTAVSASTAIKNLDMQTVICNGCKVSAGIGQSGNNGPIKYFTGTSLTQNAVKGVAQLIAADAQKNGIVSIDDLKDGEVLSSFVDYSPGSKDGSAAIVIYNGDHLRSVSGQLSAWIGGIKKSWGFGPSEVETANNQVYVTLGYIVNRIINDQLLKAVACEVAHERDQFNELKIEFDPIYSKSKVASGITSGDPIHVLLLGDANYKNNKGAGKDFDGDCKNLGAVKSNSSGDITLKNILVHRDIVIAAFSEATKKREASADHADVKDSGQEVINIVDFFEKIADQISSCVGGAISLRLVEDPEDSRKLLVVDQNYGVTDKLDVIVFDPIDGDGSTRSCEVQSNVGSQEYKAAMYVGNSKKGDAVSALRNCSPKLDQQRDKEFSKAKTDRDVLIKNPGNLGENYFNGQDINALKSVMGRLYHNNPKTVTNETVHYPGLSMELEIDGVWGLIPGNAISSTQVPKKWRDEYHSYFMVTKVVSTFQQSDWSTKISAILAYYPDLNPIYL